MLNNLKTKLAYRPEIDGLRAVAVVAVILYHSKINIFGYQLFTGGFVGVDIFFVISGYLITSIILKELVILSFSFKHFYERQNKTNTSSIVSCNVSIYFLLLGYICFHSFVDFSKSILILLDLVLIFIFIILGQYMVLAMDYSNLSFTHGHYQLKNNIIFYFQLFY